MTTGNKIVAIRKEHSLSQESFAKRIGVSRQSVSKWESDICLPEIEKLIIICKEFNLQLNYLLKDDEDRIDVKKNTDLNKELEKYNFEVNSKIENFAKKEVKKRKLYSAIVFVSLIILAGLLVASFSLNLKNDYYVNELDWGEPNEFMNNIPSSFYNFQSLDEVDKTYDIIAENYQYDYGHYDYEAIYVDYDREVVVLNLTASVRTYSANTKVRVSVISNDKLVTESFVLDELEENYYQKKVEIPFCDKVRISYTITNNGKEVSEIACEEYDIEYLYSHIYEVRHIYSPTRDRNETEFYHKSGFQIFKSYSNIENNLDLANSKLVFKLNGEYVDEELMTGNNGYTMHYNDDYKIEFGDVEGVLFLTLNEIKLLPHTDSLQIVEICLDIGLEEPKTIFTIEDHDNGYGTKSSDIYYN